MIESDVLSLEFVAGSRRLGGTVRNSLVDALHDIISDGFPSSFNLSVVNHEGVLARSWGGYANREGEPIRATRATRYDIASLTKVVSTVTLALWLRESGRWDLSDAVSTWVPGCRRDDLTLWHLVTHTSGLIAHRPFFELGRNPRAIRAAVYAEARRGGDTGEVLYSDLNFMLLGWAVERCARRNLSQLFRDEVAIPLGLVTTGYRPRVYERPSTAATELNGDQRLEPTLVWGEVHDGNAWALGGVAGHAGLFSTGDDLGRFVTALLNHREHPVLNESSIDFMTSHHAGATPDVRAIGWRLEPIEWGAWPEGSYWHTGFTGTSLLVSPAADLGVVLLTNAVHPKRQLDRQTEVRSKIHRIIAELLL